MKFLPFVLAFILAGCSQEPEIPVAGTWKTVVGAKCSDELKSASVKGEQLSSNEIEFSKNQVSLTVTRNGCTKKTVMEPEYFIENDVVVWRNAKVVYDSCTKSPKPVNKGEQRFKYELAEKNLMKFTAQYGSAGCGYLVKI